MSNTRWREAFIARLSREGMPLDLIRAVLRSAATLDRLAVVQCNGYWPYANGASDQRQDGQWVKRESVTCSRCEGGWVPSVMRVYHDGPTRLSPLVKICPDCRAQELITAKLAGSGWAPVFGGDPRGCVLKLARVGTVTVSIHNGTAESRGDVIGVPA